jgi:hypothetical protein
MAGVKKGPMDVAGMKFHQGDRDTRATPDTYRMVDFVKAVAMRDDRGQEVRVQRIRLGAPVDRESPMKVASIVLNGAWFDVTTSRADGGPGLSTWSPDGHYRVHVTNVVSAER